MPNSHHVYEEPDVSDQIDDLVVSGQRRVWGFLLCTRSACPSQARIQQLSELPRGWIKASSLSGLFCSRRCLEGFDLSEPSDDDSPRGWSSEAVAGDQDIWLPEKLGGLVLYRSLRCRRCWREAPSLKPVGWIRTRLGLFCSDACLPDHRPDLGVLDELDFWLSDQMCRMINTRWLGFVRGRGGSNLRRLAEQERLAFSLLPDAERPDGTQARGDAAILSRWFPAAWGPGGLAEQFERTWHGWEADRQLGGSVPAPGVDPDTGLPISALPYTCHRSGCVYMPAGIMFEGYDCCSTECRDRIWWGLVGWYGNVPESGPDTPGVRCARPGCKDESSVEHWFGRFMCCSGTCVRWVWDEVVGPAPDKWRHEQDYGSGDWHGPLCGCSKCDPPDTGDDTVSEAWSTWYRDEDHEDA